MLKAKNITKIYDKQKVLNKVSFVLEKGHRVALVGFNGTGKSTLLKIIAGLETAEMGQIEIHKNLKIGFLPQETNEFNSFTVVNFLKKYIDFSEDKEQYFLRQFEIMFAGFNLATEIKFKKIKELSSGQKIKVFLVGLLLKDFDLFLLDEPTNNLDLPALIWLENYLKNANKIFVVVSHDRKFLDNVANKIYEIDWVDRTLRINNGKYSDFLDQKQKEFKRQLLEHELQKEEISRLKSLAEDKKEAAARGSKWRGTDNDKMLRGFKRNRAGRSLKDAKVIYNKLDRIEKIKRPNERKQFKIEISPINTGEDRNIFVKELVCGYPDFQIGPINMQVDFGKIICILGLNGSGKSTFLKTLSGVISKISGELEIGSGVKIGNLMQEHDNLPKDKTIFDFIEQNTELRDEFLYNHLLHFGFIEDRVKDEIGNLSPGGRARLLLAFFAATGVNTLILDEPTNHLDLEAEEALETALAKFEGTVIVVTHDRVFVEKTKIDNLYLLENGKFEKVLDFNDYVSEMEKKSRKLIRLLNR